MKNKLAGNSISTVLDGFDYWKDVEEVTVKGRSNADKPSQRKLTINYKYYSYAQELGRVKGNSDIAMTLIGFFIIALAVPTLFIGLQFNINTSISLLASTIVAVGVAFTGFWLFENLWYDFIYVRESKEPLDLTLEDVTLEEAEDVAATLNEFIKSGDAVNYMKVIENIMKPQIEAKKLIEENRNIEKAKARNARLERIKNNKYLAEVSSSSNSGVAVNSIVELTSGGVRKELKDDILKLKSAFEGLQSSGKNLTASDLRASERCVSELNEVTLTLNELEGSGGVITPVMLREYRKLLVNCEKIFSNLSNGGRVRELESVENNIKISNIFLEDKFHLNV